MATLEGDEPVPLELADLHAAAGAALGEEGGRQVPLHYGDVAAEVARASDGCGLVDVSWLGRLELRGADRIRLLQGLLTADVAELESGRGVAGFFTDQQGRVLADAYVSARADRLWLELPAGRAAAVREHIERHVVIDDVQVLPLDDMLPLAVVGSAAEGRLSRLTEVPALDSHRRAVIAGTEVELSRRRLWGIEVFGLWLPASLAAIWLAEVVGPAAGWVDGWVGRAALDRLRVEAGVGRWGVDFGASHVANETGLLRERVDFEKGCYLGQEIVARIYYRGKPASECVALELAGSSEPRPGDVLRCDSGECGVVTSVAPSGDGGRWWGIGRISRAALEADLPLTTSQGEARLRRLRESPSGSGR